MLGPYILMEFRQGESLSEKLLDFDDENQRMRKNITESTLGHIYRQVAGFYLELFANDFSAIASLEMECSESGHVWRAAS
ncbi:hypothetical protein IWX90DRAFT_430773 [Phyllosticta citrichinensis]|uniref:Uncharacterized protein n=1 Tax=Phyllosticta citrichinensis TaxID=1130410 RepID=A0ABR1XWQ3_9PEZI